MDLLGFVENPMRVEYRTKAGRLVATREVERYGLVLAGFDSRPFSREFKVRAALGAAI